MTHRLPTTIDPFLTAFFGRYRAGKPSAAVARIDYLDTLLRRCLEEESAWLQCVECQSLISLERAVNHANPFATVMPLEKLVPALGYFVHAPWLRSDAAMQAAQWRLVEALLDGLEDRPDFDWSGLGQTHGMLRAHIHSGLRRASRARGSRGR
jgi:hypothetical protein